LNIVSLKHEDMEEYGVTTDCNVYSIHVKVEDISFRAKEMISTLSDTSWIKALDVIPRISYEARAERTIKKLIDSILKKVSTSVSSEFGEFLVSVTAQDTLDLHYNHNKVPLAELLKEKVKGNPGFDFHTESETNFIAFGEAKYSGIENKYNNALKQIGEFIDLKKDDSELVDLQYFVSQKAINNYAKGKKAYVAAFSINDETPTNVITKALNSKHIAKLLQCNELYIIGIEIDVT